MHTPLKLLSCCLLLAMLLPAAGCGCGFDCNSGNENNPSLLTLGLSDALPEDLKQVVIEVDSITFRRNGGSEVKVDSFTFDTAGEDFVDAASFQIDLLLYRGVNQQVVIENMEIPTGTYDEVALEILVGSPTRSFVQQQDDAIRQLDVTGGVLTLPGIRLSAGTQRIVIEFGLAQALQYQSATDTYLLTSTGVRIENTATAATLSGQVDTSLFNAVAPCDAKTDPLSGNRVYLYPGKTLSATDLADVFTPASTPTPPTNAIAPFAVASLLQDTFTGNWQYSFGYVPAGDYTLAFACDTAADDPVNFNNLVVPLPADQLREVSLSEGEKAVCDLKTNARC